MSLQFIIDVEKEDDLCGDEYLKHHEYKVRVEIGNGWILFYPQNGEEPRFSVKTEDAISLLKFIEKQENEK